MVHPHKLQEWKPSWGVVVQNELNASDFLTVPVAHHSWICKLMQLLEAHKLADIKTKSSKTSYVINK